METNLQVLNKISQKLGGSADATSVTESLNNIANALGDTNPDVIKSVSDSLNDILEYAGNGGGGSAPKVLTVTFVNETLSNIDLISGHIFSTSYTILTDDFNILENSDLIINANSTKSIEMMIPGNLSGALFQAYLDAADLVNCTFSKYSLEITDLTKDASITLTYADGGDS